MEICSDPNSDRPDLVDIKKLVEIILPEHKVQNEFEKRISIIKKTKQIL